VSKVIIPIVAFIILLGNFAFLYAGSYDDDDDSYNNRPRHKYDRTDYFEMGKQAGNRLGGLAEVIKANTQRQHELAIAKVQAQSAVDAARIQSVANDDLNSQKTLYAMNQQRMLVEHPELRDPAHPFTKIVAAVEREFPVFLTIPDGPIKTIELAKQRYELQQLKRNRSNQKGLSQLKVDKAIKGWKHLENWRALQEGMTKEDVRSLMGEPERISKNVIGFEDWNYGTGNITFDSGGLVAGWDEPLK